MSLFLAIQESACLSVCGSLYLCVRLSGKYQCRKLLQCSFASILLKLGTYIDHMLKVTSPSKYSVTLSESSSGFYVSAVYIC